jgi:hypothetical protein
VKSRKIAWELASFKQEKENNRIPGNNTISKKILT